jgi:hypothetical protein
VCNRAAAQGETVALSETELKRRLDAIQTSLTSFGQELDAFIAELHTTPPDDGTGGTDPDPDPDPDEETPPDEDPDVPTPTPTVGIWIGEGELQRLPTSGAAFDALKARALGAIGTHNLGDLNSNADMNTFAAALYAARTGDLAVGAKAIKALQDVQRASLGTRTLEPARNLGGYVLAADVLGYRDLEFKKWVGGVLNATLQGHSGSKNIIQTGEFAANNWGTMARAATLIAGVYLQDTAIIQRGVKALKRFLGDESASNLMLFSDTNWHDDPKHPSGINRIVPGRSDGAMPEDMRRGGEYKEVPSKTGYAFEALQGVIVAAHVAWRAGLFDPFAYEDFAILRAYDYLNRIKWYPEGDDRWQAWLINFHSKRLGKGIVYAGPTMAPPSTPGKLMGFTDWTHST